VAAYPAAVDALEPFVADPAGSAIALDVDGTLAPIVARPDLAVVPPATLALLGELADRYGVVACVSGRLVRELRYLVPDDRIQLIGCHGLEDRRGFLAAAAAHAPAVERAAAVLVPLADSVGAWVEDKGVALIVHYREAPDPAEAAATLARAAPHLEALGLRVRPARMGLEVLPPVPVDKGTALSRLMATAGSRRSMYAGDDLTDVAALRVADLPVAVASPEAPAELLEAAEIVVDGPEGLVELLDRL
jgi:trehalose 6-phosphate phosphatase